MEKFDLGDIEKLKEQNNVKGLISLLRDEDTSKKAAATLIEIGKQAVLPLISALDDSSVAGDAMWILGEIKDERAVMPLLSLLVKRGELTIFRRAVAMLLVKMGGSAVEPLIEALNSEFMFVRTEAVKALGEIRDSRALEPLIRVLMHDQFSTARQRAAIALGNIGGQRAFDALKQALTQEQDAVVTTWIEEALKKSQK